MAIIGDISIPALGLQILLTDKYMRLAEVTVRNEWRPSQAPQPDGEDGNPNNPIEMLEQVREVSGRLDIYAAATDIEGRIAPITSQAYTTTYDPVAGFPERQLYQHIMTLLPRAEAG